MTLFKRYDFVAGINIPLVWSGGYADLLGIAEECDNENVSLTTFWSQCRDGKPWFVGDSLRFNIKKDNIIHANNLSFPWDLPGKLPLIIRHDEDAARFQEVKRNSKISDMNRIKKLLAYVTLNGDNAKDFSNLIDEFMEKENWNPNWFLQGVRNKTK